MRRNYLFVVLLAGFAIGRTRTELAEMPAAWRSRRLRMTFVTAISLSGSGKRRQLWFLVGFPDSYDSLYPMLCVTEQEHKTLLPPRLAIQTNADYGRPFTAVIFGLGSDYTTM